MQSWEGSIPGALPGYLLIGVIEAFADYYLAEMSFGHAALLGIRYGGCLIRLAALERIDKYADPFGGPLMSLSPSKHAGEDYLNLYEVVDGKWAVVERNLPH